MLFLYIIVGSGNLGCGIAEKIIVSTTDKNLILVVEDEQKIRDVICMYLQKAGYDVVQTQYGREALQIARAQKPALIVLDVMLPKMSGYEVCEQLKTDPETRDIIILILSAKGQESEKLEGYQVGADHYETKPFSPKALVEKIDSLLSV